jgi:hypothetical protein
MTNDTISNPNGFFDDLCNQIILYSSTVAKELGITYGELWVSVMILTFIVLLWYIVLNYLTIYTNRKKLCKILFWVSTAIIGFFLIMTIGDFGVYCKYHL